MSNPKDYANNLRKRGSALAPAIDVTDEQADSDAGSAADMGLALAQLTEAQGLVSFDPRTLVERIRSEGYVAAERFLDLKEGQMFEGWLTGRGPTIITDKRTMKPKEVMRYKFELTSGARVSMLGATMLDSALSDLPDDGTCAVVVAKGGKKETSNKNQMDEYIVLAKPNARKPPALSLPAPAVQEAQ